MGFSAVLIDMVTVQALAFAAEVMTMSNCVAVAAFTPIVAVPEGSVRTPALTPLVTPNAANVLHLANALFSAIQAAKLAWAAPRKLTFCAQRPREV